MLVMTEDLFRWFNFCEGIFWIAIAGGLVVIAACRRKDVGLTLFAAAAFAAFGISDFVEITTGGWYKPWWLAVWKIGCAVGLLGAFVIHQRTRRRVAANNT